MIPCPHCGRKNDVHEGVNTQGSPDEGSVSLCWKCREPGLFDADGSLRKPSPEERAAIMANEDVKAALYVMREALRPSEAKTMYERISREGPQ